MTFDEVLQEMEAAGTEQNRKIYRRHGARDPLFGVSTAFADKLVKKIKIDHALALQLWATGNYDVQVLAARIADPQQTTPELLESWMNDVDNYGLAGYIAGLANKTGFARELAEKWIASGEEWRGRAGWLMLAELADKNPGLPDSYFEQHLATIERDIHGSLNYVRDGMNSALINFGIRNEALREKALATAGRIGKVNVDHGQTGCKTPDATGYILKTVEYRAKKAASKRA
jgi:3-methyladenine DNA glycosylase AlkD